MYMYNEAMSCDILPCSIRVDDGSVHLMQYGWRFEAGNYGKRLMLTMWVEWSDDSLDDPHGGWFLMAFYDGEAHGFKLCGLDLQCEWRRI